MKTSTFRQPPSLPDQRQPAIDEGKRTMDADASRSRDEELLARLGSGDADSAVAFVHRFKRAVFGVALAITGDLGTAEDVALRAFEQASRHAKAYDRQQGSVRGWLTRIALDLGLEVIHARAAMPVALDDLLTAMSGPPDRLAVAREGTAVLRGMLARLPTTQARAVAMVSIYGMTARQIADAEDVPLTTARTWIRDGMRKLGDAGPGSVATAAN